MPSTSSSTGAMRIGIPKETRADETRVAATPDVVRKYIEKGASVAVESGAGERAAFDDEGFRAAGGRASDRAKPRGPRTSFSRSSRLRRRRPAGSPRHHAGVVPVSGIESRDGSRLERGRVNAVAMESVPRIARAQKMDALSSMANLRVQGRAGSGQRLRPLLSAVMTAAGTIPPAHVLVIGAGVAGLSAIVTARRLGAVVQAFDPRPAVKEQVQSLGARFLDLPLEAGETAGGYATTQSEEFLRLERELLATQLDEVDVVITTALIRGEPAPLLITDAMLRAMKPGSVVVDLAVEQGGNCEGSRPDEVASVMALR